MVILGDKICDSTDGSCKYGCKPFEQGGVGCTGETFRREYAQQHVLDMANAIIADAERYGLVLTIETVPTPGEPLAMGNHVMVASVRPARVMAVPLTKGWDD